MWRCISSKKAFNPAAAGTTSEQRSENGHDKDAHHDVVSQK
jgi:hypothetical protein